MKAKSKKTANKKRTKQAAASGSAGLPEWNDLEAKKKVFQDIIGEILLDSNLGQLYVQNDKAARDAFAARIKVPANVKIVFLQSGDTATPGGGSAIIELPVSGTGTMSPDEKLELFLCTYNPW